MQTVSRSFLHGIPNVDTVSAQVRQSGKNMVNTVLDIGNWSHELYDIVLIVLLV